MDIRSVEAYSKNFLNILTKKGEMSRLYLNEQQRKICEIIRNDDKNGRPSRIIVLKARQLGISTLGSAIIYNKCATNFYRKGVIIAHDDDSTNNIFNMTKRYWELSPKLIRPMKRYSNAKELVFENPDEATRSNNPGLMSRIEIETANKDTAGRSGTISFLHCSETAFWKKAGTVVSSLFQSVPRERGTLIFIESTANGMSGCGLEFYERWQAASQGESEFTPVFFPWWENEEYEIKDSAFEMTHEEKDYAKTFNLSAEKMAWRRYKIKNDMGRALLDPEDQFKQEYPSCPSEAFIASGRPLFPVQRLISDIEKAKNIKYEIGDFNGNGDFIESANGKTKRFKKHDARRKYAIGADVAEGIDGGDYSAATVISDDFEIVATYHAHIHADVYGADLCRIGSGYFNAVLACEVNNHGLTTVTKIRDLNYPNIYMSETQGESFDKMTRRLGWHTNTKTKMKMLDDFVACYRDESIKINDVELLKEMLTLTIDAGGDVDLNGKDRVVGACIAIQAMKQMVGDPPKAIRPGQMPKPTDSTEIKLEMLEKRAKYESNFS